MLFLKHNLNAQAIGSLGNESANIQEEIERLRAKISLLEIENEFLKKLDEIERK